MILVLGTGRSGTSEVARALVELGVDMGRAFHVGDRFNPKGYFEDREAQALHLSFHLMNLDNIDYEQPWEMWRAKFQEFIDGKEEPWGLKDPGVVDHVRLLEEYLTLNPRIIHTVRDYEDTINSFMRMKNIGREEAEKLVNQRLEHNKRALEGDYLEIECYTPYEEKKAKIKEWLGNSLE